MASISLKANKKITTKATKGVAPQKKKLIASQGITKKKAVSKNNKTGKNKVTSKQSTAKKSTKLAIKRKSYVVPEPAELKKLYLAGYAYLDTFPVPKTVDAPKIKGFDLNQGVDYNKMFANLKY